MKVRGRKNEAELKARAKHHARRLLPFVNMMSDIINRFTGAEMLHTRLRIHTRHHGHGKGPGKTYIIRGYKEHGNYLGIEIKPLRRPGVVLIVKEG